MNRPFVGLSHKISFMKQKRKEVKMRKCKCGGTMITIGEGHLVCSEYMAVIIEQLQTKNKYCDGTGKISLNKNIKNEMKT